MSKILRNLQNIRHFTAGQLTSSARSAKPIAAINFRSFGGDSHGADHHDDHHETFMDPKKVSDRIIQVVKGFEKISFLKVITRNIKVDANKVTALSQFREDLGLDSLDAVEIVIALEEEFTIDIPDSEADKFHAIADATEYICNHPMAK